ncbi:MAG: tRNA (adenosine(37)-N6)-threonylcarbamoyltransferase complex ATPase subunit type 1 TsaE [Candidatus Yonathbacteria bacterium RIFOXYC1_FULL_52_10]|uniref:tRNA threonylcarbamoyladenosine biosynthesis protein TsaE n=1 Tax=Candidatus Yonathbacteria bacterium RIFOXYD1_FULL_52_36 TaxID=1802730 RepID=A0A1G2SMP2_9BACT|nr:MAG: tRNA (adenosine(37)-N6)-threonylcarbamoyltransferase complex ATPase subunit type 1 TsaE [Candidatus Yonathbacteria bacterium RIFOXYC1_FULL_52_10]OHA85968.1 MAG: tRNA (adenosine(37)-N6)-threonylcarbamoyltransferase complex ATPase subunit type 1 TsaE [Candidatus Yonathbacteria bacterium RIFOXYD1_FULL_52_36]
MSGRATVLALRGNLGAGKTALTKALGKQLGVKRAITSPTFVIEKIYKLPKGSPFEHLIHIDAYRLEGKRELEAIGWDEALAHHNNLIVIEWPEQVPGSLPRHAFTVDLAFVNDTTRTITIPAKLSRLWPPQKTKKK